MSHNLKAYELKDETKANLEKQLNDLKLELSSLRVSQATGAATAKLSKIRTVRKSIARIMTVIHQTQRRELRKFYSKKKLIPLDLRPKKTRAMRRRLSKADASRVTERQRKNAIHFPQRKYALRA